jgi:hypothetical protein
VRTSILAKDLELIALQQIRAFPGAEYVVSAHVERTNGEWALVVNAKEGADFDRIQYAVRTTERRLRNRYTLQPVQ